ncbi:MAG: hypothetical protein SXG53_10140 [Pseudomonadota bacterium]|nr:hypothetical protein [Pseudomonadota bacterium]
MPGIGFVIGFSTLIQLVLPTPVNRPLHLIRRGVLRPVFLMALTPLHSRLYQRWYSSLFPYCCPIPSPRR